MDQRYSLKSLFLKHRNLVLFLSAIVTIDLIAWYHISRPEVLINGRVVLTSSSNESEYSLYLRTGDVLRIKIKVTGDPTSLYIHPDYFKHHLSAKEGIPLDYIFCSLAEGMYTFCVRTEGEDAEVEIKISLIDHVIPHC